jgi:hypothetical protein
MKSNVHGAVPTHVLDRPSLSSRRKFLVNPLQSIGSNVRQEEMEWADESNSVYGKGQPWWSVPARAPTSFFNRGVSSRPLSCLPANKKEPLYPNVLLPQPNRKIEPFTFSQAPRHSKASKFIPHVHTDSLQFSSYIPSRRTVLELVRVLSSHIDPDSSGRWSLPHPIAYQQLLSSLCDISDHRGLDQTACNPHFLTQFLISDSMGRAPTIRSNLPADPAGCRKAHSIESFTELAEGEVGICLLEQLLERAALCFDSTARTANGASTPPASMARREVEDRLRQARSFVREHACRLRRWPALAVVLSARGVAASAKPLWHSRAMEHVHDALDALNAGRAFRAKLDVPSAVHQLHAAAGMALKLERWIVPCLLHGCFAAISEQALDEAFGMLEFTHSVLASAAVAPNSPDRPNLGWTERLAARNGGALLAVCRAAIARQREGLALCRSCFDHYVTMGSRDRASGREHLEGNHCDGVWPAPGPMSGPSPLPTRAEPAATEDLPAGIRRCIAALRRSPEGGDSRDFPSLTCDSSAGQLHPDAEVGGQGGWRSASVIVSGAPLGSAGIRCALFSRILPEIGRCAVEFHGMTTEFLDLEAMNTRFATIRYTRMQLSISAVRVFSSGKAHHNIRLSWISPFHY